MKVFIGGELEHSISDKFRKARNSVIEYMDCLCDISYINELSFYVFCLKGFTANPLSRYSKKRNRIELEILLPFDKFETANDSQCVEILKQSLDINKDHIEILKQSILDAIENYKNKNIPQQYIDVIVEKMKASINE